MDKILFTILGVLFSINAFGSIVESNQLIEIFSHLEKDTLILLDIDNTIIEPLQYLGTDAWACKRLENLQNQGLSPKEAYEKTSQEWQHIHAITKVKTVEPNTAALICNLQLQGYPIMALTARIPQSFEMTIRQLAEVSIDFSGSAPNLKLSSFPSKEGVMLKNGILFVSSHSKANILKEFLEKGHYFPKKIIFVDDKLHHVKDLQNLCNLLHIDYVGIRYGATDCRESLCNPKVAEVQLFFIENILSDEIASIILKNHS